MYEQCFAEDAVDLSQLTCFYQEQIRKEKKRQEWIIREAKIREEAKTREETITRESRPQEEEEQARLMSLGYAPTRVYQSEAYMFYQLLTRHNGCFTFMLVLLQREFSSH